MAVLRRDTRTLNEISLRRYRTSSSSALSEESDFIERSEIASEQEARPVPTLEATIPLSVRQAFVVHEIRPALSLSAAVSRLPTDILGLILDFFMLRPRCLMTFISLFRYDDWTGLLATHFHCH